jgi:ubiquinone/menaquinone biosynthesis C-methylase UbiE
MSKTDSGFYNQFKTFLKHRILMTQLEWTSWNDNALHIITKNVSERKPEMILDIGCGDGKGVILIANSFNVDFHNVYGVDINDVCLKACQEKFNAIKMDIEKNELPFRNDIFDLVICNQVLEHVINYRNVMTDAIRVTRSGGYVLFGIPNLSHLINRIFLLFGIQPLCIALDGPHIHAFTHKSFVKLLKSLDQVEMIDFTGMVMYPLPYFLAKIMSKHFVGLTGYTCYLLRKK